MTNKSDYTEEEWNLLGEAPLLAGFTVLMAGKTGLGTFKETVALSKGFIVGAQKYPDNELIRTLATGGEAKQAEKHFSKAIKGMAPAQVQAHTIEQLAKVKDILDVKTSAQEADEYKKWVMELSASVAQAAKEGGHLGFGGVRVSEPEKKALGAIADALDADLLPDLAV
ncbi:MAG TPA: hypothetical protein EYP41_11025 [Anaerolineae bacterium]|nr:hypothetical protein [Anaerolineae bacterium]HIP70445.1 hypothetical protein [Anaerolineae bacterium]